MALGVKPQSSSAALRDCKSPLASSSGPARSFMLRGKGGKVALQGWKTRRRQIPDCLLQGQLGCLSVGLWEAVSLLARGLRYGSGKLLFQRE